VIIDKEELNKKIMADYFHVPVRTFNGWYLIYENCMNILDQKTINDILAKNRTLPEPDRRIITDLIVSSLMILCGVN